MVSEEPVKKQKAKRLKEGYLYKKVKKDWKKRYFVLTELKLYFFETMQDENQIGAMSIALIDLKHLENNAYDVANHDYFWMIQGSTHSHIIASPTENERKEWIEAIQQAKSVAMELRKANQKSSSTPTESVPKSPSPTLQLPNKSKGSEMNGKSELSKTKTNHNEPVKSPNQSPSKMKVESVGEVVE